MLVGLLLVVMIVGILLLLGDLTGRSTHTVPIRIVAASILCVLGQVLLLPGDGLL